MTGGAIFSFIRKNAEPAILPIKRSCCLPVHGKKVVAGLKPHLGELLDFDPEARKINTKCVIANPALSVIFHFLVVLPFLCCISGNIRLT